MCAAGAVFICSFPSILREGPRRRRHGEPTSRSEWGEFASPPGPDQIVGGRAPGAAKGVTIH